MEAKPRFRTEGKRPGPVTVWLQCSNEPCQKDIRILRESESIKVTKGYYCKECDDGAHHINFPVNTPKQDN